MGFRVYNREESPPKKKVDRRVKEEDYPELAEFVKLGMMDEEAVQNWTVIGHENAAMLQNKWKKLIDDISSFITGEKSPHS